MNFLNMVDDEIVFEMNVVLTAQKYDEKYDEIVGNSITENERMTATQYFNHQNLYDIHERRYSTGSPQRSPRFGSTRRRKRLEYFEDTSEGSDARTSSDEYETSPQPAPTINIQPKNTADNNNNSNHDNVNNKSSRKNSTFSTVKKKITSTFQRRHSVAHLNASSSQQNIHKPPPLRRLSTNDHSSVRPSLPQRQASFDDPITILQNKRKGSLRRTATMAAGRLNEQQNQLATGSNPMLNRILQQKSQFQLEACSSTPNICSAAKMPTKTFHVHLLGCTSVGKTALTVRFLTGRYIHEYKSASEETYTRVMKYGDEQVNVKISINDIENMKGDIELDPTSGIMILYSIVDRKSFTEAKSVLKYLAKSSILGYYPVMLVGTKRDLSRMRKIPRKEAHNIANKYSCTQFDVSSASDRRVKDSFHALFRQIEIRHLIQTHDDIGRTIINPPTIQRNGTIRYGTA